jgi:cephalosporin hydroxylase
MLFELFMQHTGHPIFKWKHYLPAYERHFVRFQSQSVLVIELGVGLGGSLQLWKKFFGPHATIVGIDINRDLKQFEEDQINIRIGSQSDKKFLQGVIEEFGTPDIIIDDGSHIMDDVNASFDFLYPLLAKNGVYCVEDLHTAYWEDYGGGYKRSSTFIERSKLFIDSLNAHHSRGQFEIDNITSSTMSIHVYDSMVFLEKGLHGSRECVWVPGPPN